MTKRYIVVMPPVALVDLTDTPINGPNGSPASWTMPEFVKTRLVDKAFGKDMDGILSAVSIRSAFTGKGVGDVVELDEDDWQRLRDATKTPADGYNPIIGACLVTFMRSIVDAATERPKLQAVAAE